MDRSLRSIFTNFGAPASTTWALMVAFRAVRATTVMAAEPETEG